MSTGNGKVTKEKGQQAINAARTTAGPNATTATKSESVVASPPPAPRFPLKVTLRLAQVLGALPLLLWVLLAFPRAREITGAVQGSGNGGGELLFVALMLAAISIIVSALAVLITMFSHSEIADRIVVEHGEAELLKPPMIETEGIAVAAAEERNRAFGATDALVGTYQDGLKATEHHFWEGFYRRHAEDPEIYGTWDDKQTLKTRFKDQFNDLFQGPDMLTPDELKSLIEAKRTERANFRDPRANADA
jgi:hypothetical protein